MPQGETPPCPQRATRPHPPISGRATPIPGHAGPQAPTSPRCTMLLGASASMDGPLSRNPPCHVVFPCALRIGDGSRPAFASVQDDSLSSAPSATNLKTAGGVSEITPRKRGSCLTACVVTLRFMACLNWLLLRVGSDRVAGASAKAPDSGERPWASAARAPGAEQVTCLRGQASPVTSRMHRCCRAALWIYVRRART